MSQENGTKPPVAEPRLVDSWFDECRAGYAYLKPTGKSFYRADDGGIADGEVVGVESGEFDLPKASVTLLTELEALAQGDFKTKLRELREGFERFPEGTYLWMWWSKLYPGTDSRYMPTFDEQAYEDEFRRLRALSIQAARLLDECGLKTKKPDKADETATLAAKRQSVVMPILTAKRWSRNKLATDAGVSPTCVNEYLAGKRRLTPENRRAIAQELGLKPEELPN